MTTKFTFKKQPRETGLRSVGHPYQSVDIKHNKKVVGTINAPYWPRNSHKWDIQLAVRDGDLWTWRTFRKRFDTEADARQFLQENAESILSKHTLHYFEEE